MKPMPPQLHWVPPRRNLATPAIIVIGCLAGLSLCLLGLWAIMGGFSPSSGKAISTKVAVSRSASGQLIIYVLTCPGESIEQVSLTLEDSQATKDLATLWEIRSSARAATSQFTVGENPPGFQAVGRMTTALKPNDMLSANIVTYGGRQFATEFHSRDAWHGSVHLGEDNYLQSWFDNYQSGTRASLAKFRSLRNLVCENQNYPIGG
jgi:hypothetical protein